MIISFEWNTAIWVCYMFIGEEPLSIFTNRSMIGYYKVLAMMI